MENNINYRSNNRFWLGALFLVGGGLLLASKLGAPIPHWVFSWQVFLIAMGFYSGIKHRFQSGGWLILIGVGTYFLLDENLADYQLHQYLLPVMIMLVGVIFILCPKKRFFRNKNRWRYNWDDKAKHAFDGALNGDNTSSTGNATATEEVLYINSVFSGVKRTVFSKNFKGGEISCVFGGAEIDLLQADIQGIVTLKLDEVFGGIELRIPSNWTVQTQIDGMFHGVDDKRRFQENADPNKVLILKGSAVFAGIEIKSH